MHRVAALAVSPQEPCLLQREAACCQEPERKAVRAAQELQHMTKAMITRTTIQQLDGRPACALATPRTRLCR